MRRAAARIVPLTVALGVFGAVACSSGASSGGDDAGTTLKIALWDYTTTPEFKALIDGFEAKYPKIHIEPVDIPSATYSDRVTALLAEGDTTDVLTLKNVTDYARFVSLGQLRSVTGVVESLQEKSAYGGLPDFEYNGRYFAVPYRQDFWVLFYNKALVGNADMSHLTWSGFATLAEQLTHGSGPSKVYGTYLHTWRSVVQAVAAAQTGGDLLGGDYSFFKDQYTMALDVQKAGATLPFATASSRKTTYDAQFTTGKAAMVPMGTWWAAALLAEKAQGKNDVDWGMAPLPQIRDDGTVTTFGSPTAFAVNMRSTHLEASEKFIEWAAGPEGAAVLAKIGIVPSYTDDAITEEFFGVRDMPTDVTSQQAMQPAKVQLEMPVSARSAGIDQILTEEHQRVMTGQKSVGAGIAEMDHRVRTEVR
ncbi:ABC transporter substrate-binding protein [Actinacidiphila epipremni]|uniref:Extracellular solute-binding protein n=1 Tax=Actinacidiphila epipremni TaxID=2053013 RepID=A0ABX0ZVZ7_9ACTN|nr:extracellular solute-binding protein [Actinacidiphila epipremni]NJP46736.1 extracellular solute-binding protein [Actinacidiphila epipremni]